MADGYLYAANFEINARVSKATRANARQRVAIFAERTGPWLRQAVERTPGYGEHQAGVDLWLEQTGAGAGFTDRKKLDQAPDAGQALPLADRNGRPYLPDPGATLAECLSAAAYGTPAAIAPGAYVSAYTSRGWLYLV